MPEGDTIHRAARNLGRALIGRPLVEYWAYRPQLMQPRRAARTVEAIEARGKNLLVRFDDQWVLYSHMRMTGSWHVYGPDERWRKPQHLARVVMRNEAYVAVCFSAPVIELLTAPAVERHPTLSTLGPDLLAPELDEQGILQNLEAVAEVPLGEAVMNQRVLAGIGNVYKSEMLFMGRLDPFAPVSSVDEDARRNLVRRTREMMQANLDTWRRTTRKGPGSRHWVYERSGQPCFRCRTRIRMQRQGDQGRSTYFCPRCQKVG